MREDNFWLESGDGSNFFVREWFPGKSEDIKCILQVAHGMAEHSARYREFASSLAESGIGVYANDHRGHGETAGSPENVGFFAEKNGWEKVVDDMYLLTCEIKKKNSGIPLFLLGHSLGSLLSRDLISRNGEEFSGAILSGTAADPGLLGNIGIIISIVSGKLYGKRSKSPLLDKLSFGSFNGKFRPNRTKFDWLSRDEDQVDRYIADPYCGGIFSAGFFNDMLMGIKKIHKKENVLSVPEDLPLFFISGEKDPVGKFTRGVKKTIKFYKKARVRKVDFKFYKDARHEILNETNREEVYTDIITWIGEQLSEA